MSNRKCIRDKDAVKIKVEGEKDKVGPPSTTGAREAVISKDCGVRGENRMGTGRNLHMGLSWSAAEVRTLTLIAYPPCFVLVLAN